MSYYVVPPGMVLVGTCGSCGGPVLSPAIIYQNGTQETPSAGSCGLCQRRVKADIQPTYGPVKEME